MGKGRVRATVIQSSKANGRAGIMDFRLKSGNTIEVELGTLEGNESS